MTEKKKKRNPNWPPKRPPQKRLSFSVDEDKAEDFLRLADMLGTRKTHFIALCALIGLNTLSRAVEPEKHISEGQLKDFVSMLEKF